MEKDFDGWNEIKKKIDIGHENKLYTVREIWWCSLGLNIGSEQNGTGPVFDRPVLILKGCSKNTCLVVPLTTSVKIHKTRVPIGLVDKKFASALISQMKVVDTKRLIDKIGFLDKNVFNNVRKIAKDFL